MVSTCVSLGPLDTCIDISTQTVNIMPVEQLTAIVGIATRLCLPLTKDSCIPFTYHHATINYVFCEAEPYHITSILVGRSWMS